MKSLYIHFPFCETKCHYCDFYSIPRDRVKAQDEIFFEEALQLEISRQAHLLAPTLDTLFFGGGTPSMTAYDSMARALAPLWDRVQLSPSVEWTLEANPSSITGDAIKAYRSWGANRMSVGIQTLRPDLLKLLGRVHSRETALTALETIFSSGIDNVSVDLLCGIPGQNEADLADELSILTRFPITHLSCYLLTLPPHHRLYPKLPTEEVQLNHLLFVHQWMTGAGFEHYEISNFAKPGKRAQHNLRYWKGLSYLGLGPSAHSYDSISHRRWKNVSSLHKYVDLNREGNSAVEWSETLTAEQLELERWMLTLRLDEGFPTDWLATPLQKSRARLFEEQGLLEPHPVHTPRMRLTAKGFALSDQIIRSLV